MAKSPPCTITQTPFVAPLECLSKTSLELAGGKAANLGELLRAGFPVPTGFAVTTTAYEQFVVYNGLDETIAQELRAPPVGGAAIRDAFQAGAIPPEIEQDIRKAYRQLGQSPAGHSPSGHSPVAVRSSATAEDLPEAAFAGQQDTYLNILGDDSLLEAVRRCWASLWTDRAIAYRDRQEVDQKMVKLAVVVQRMAAAEFAGVLFTANPVTGRRDEILIDANPGLGEAVVSGLVTPDHFVLRRQVWGWQIAERRAGKREAMVQALAGGGTQHVTGAAIARIPALPDRALRRLARLGSAIQRHFGSPQDIEWAWAGPRAGGRPYILQARPMTALPGPPPATSLAHRMLANNFVEMLPSRPYPLDLDTWMEALGGAVEPIFDLVGLEWHLSHLFDVEDGVVLGYHARFPRPTWRTLLTPVRLVSNILRYRLLQWRSDPLIAETLARARQLESRDLRLLSWDELLAAARAAQEIPFLAAGEIRRRYFPGAAYAAARLRVLLALMGRANLFGTLVSGVENKTLEMNRALEELAHKVRSDPALSHIVGTHPAVALGSALEQDPAGRVFLAELEAFLDRYGHRETVISTTLQPTWKDAPAVTLGIIKSFAAYPPQPPAGPPAWQAARDEVLQSPLLRFAPLRSVFLKSLEEARLLIQIREDTHFYATLAMPLFRRTFLEMGGRLAAAGYLEAPEEIFHLKFSELERVSGFPLPPDRAAELAAAVQRRKKRRSSLESTPLVDPRLFPHGGPSGDALLRGMPGSPGVAEGPVRIVRDGAEFGRLAPGDVLVAPYTNPAWTPLFQRAAAVVVDTGSLASHAAIVAREYGIPAVMATVSGTQTLQDGEWVRVDGSQGTVVRAAPPTSPPAGVNPTDWAQGTQTR